MLSKSLELAEQHGIKSIAFPLIATGSFKYPKEKGMRIALDEISTFLLKSDMLIYLVVFDEESTELAKKISPDLKEYINLHYNDIEEGEYYIYCLTDKILVIFIFCGITSVIINTII